MQTKLEIFESNNLEIFNNLAVGSKLYMFTLVNQIKDINRQVDIERNIYECYITKQGRKLITVERFGREYKFDKTDIFKSYYLREHSDFTTYGLFLKKEDIYENLEKEKLEYFLRTYDYSNLTYSALKKLMELIGKEN